MRKAKKTGKLADKGSKTREAGRKEGTATGKETLARKRKDN